LGKRIPIERIRRVDEHNWKHASFPYAILGSDNRLFAYGIMDLDNRDDVLRSDLAFWYFHISNQQHPSGLILRQVPSSGTWRVTSAERVAERAVVATIFQTSGEAINPDFFQEKEGGYKSEMRLMELL